MKTLSDLSVLDLLPLNAQGDANMRAAALAMDPHIKPLIEKAERANYIRRIMTGNITEAEADEFAWQFKVAYYDQSLPFEQKLKIVQTAITHNNAKATPAAIENIVSILFGDGEVQEWNQYGGEPGYYRVVTSNADVNADRAQEFARAIKSVTRLSAWLESVIVIKQEEQRIYYGAATQNGRKVEIRG